MKRSRIISIWSVGFACRRATSGGSTVIATRGFGSFKKGRRWCMPWMLTRRIPGRSQWTICCRIARPENRPANAGAEPPQDHEEGTIQEETAVTPGRSGAALSRIAGLLARCRVVEKKRNDQAQDRVLGDPAGARRRVRGLHGRRARNLRGSVRSAASRAVHGRTTGPVAQGDAGADRRDEEAWQACRLRIRTQRHGEHFHVRRTAVGLPTGDRPRAADQGRLGDRSGPIVGHALCRLRAGDAGAATISTRTRKGRSTRRSHRSERGRTSSGSTSATRRNTAVG